MNQMDKTYTSLDEAWNQTQQEPTVWDYLAIKDRSFYYVYGNQSLFLSSFQTKDLPEPPYQLTPLGKVLTKMSHFANIMSRRPGTEEVTFYALLNEPQSGLLGRKIDEKMLNIGVPPLVWRREQIKRAIREKVEAYIKANESFLFLDIGSGGGFDSLEIERLMHRMSELTQNTQWSNSYASINVDIDTKWLENNQKLAEEMFGENHNIVRENISAFDFLSDKSYRSTLKKYDNLIISCNGFAEFLSDAELQKLYLGIRELTDSFEGNATVILPFANKNEKQEAVGKKIGFQFRAKDKQEMTEMINDLFAGYQVSNTEKHSHIVMFIEK
jgi:SAM-dependent methyltransferase